MRNEKELAVEILRGFILGASLIIFFYALVLIGSAWEDHARCKNGATEYCIPEDK